MSPASGEAPSALSVSADSAGWAPGAYTGSIEIEAEGATGSPVAAALRPDHLVYSSPDYVAKLHTGAFLVVLSLAILIVHFIGGTFFAFAGVTGQVLWSYKTLGEIQSSAAVGDIDSDLPTTPTEATAAIAKDGAIEIVIDAAFATAGELAGFVEVTF